MRRSTLSIFGLYNYDNTIFDNFVVPESVDKDNVIENILIECAELECLFSSPDMMKFAIGSWSKKELFAWEKMDAALRAEYNPIENYDRKEIITDKETRDLTRDDTETRDLSAESTNSGTDTSTNQVSAFNDTDFSNKDKNTLEHGMKNNSKNTGTVGVVGTQKGTITNEHDNHTHGNIGITTSQQMIESEIALRSKYNIVSIIVESFKRRFCLLIY